MDDEFYHMTHGTSKPTVCLRHQFLRASNNTLARPIIETSVRSSVRPSHYQT